MEENEIEGGLTDGKPMRNPFIIRVIQDWGPHSPEAVVKDEYQPSTGSLLTLRPDMKKGDPTDEEGVNKADILKCKSLNNEELAPVLRATITLSLSENSLMRKRGRSTL